MQGAAAFSVYKVKGAEIGTPESDLLAIEEPLEIRLLAVGGDLRRGEEAESISLTMRTPGQDADLAIGFLFTEGIIRYADQIAEIKLEQAAITVVLQAGVVVDMQRLDRNFTSTSSCGVCGKSSLAALNTCDGVSIPAGAFRIEIGVVQSLPETLRREQAVFDGTGGLHAAALFDAKGNLISSREDVGRHNAVDKLIGGQLRAGRMPLSENLMLVSGRASFELVQKALMAGIPALAAVGAPSSLAVKMAVDGGMTLIGFLRDGRFNIYSHCERILSNQD